VADILLIVGLSGAGRSQAADDLEDLGWFVVDNMPITLVDKVVELAENGAEDLQLALVLGTPSNQTNAIDVVANLREAGHRVRILYLDASTSELVKRYGATRRKHPLSSATVSVEEAILKERSLLEQVKGSADLVIDTSSLNVHQLKSQIQDLFAAVEFVDKIDALFGMLIPAYRAEGKSYLTVAIGCTGGRHRSVAIAEEIGRKFIQLGHNPRVIHRDIAR